jgi:hypothetical protein
MTSAATTAEPLLACGNCRAPMQRLTLAGHYGRGVDLDLCRGCDLVWFDGSETAQLAGPGLLTLIGAMASSQVLAHEMLRADPRCPCCAGALGVVHNQSRWGRSTQLQCLRRHGAYQSFAQFLEEKGLLRPMSRVDRARLVQSRGRIDCVNCGGEIGTDDERCPYCRSIPSLLDVARLAHALDPLDTIEPPAVYRTAATQSALQCVACGVALPPGETIRCTQCGATLAIASLAEAAAAVQALAPALREAAAHPAPALIARRLAAIDADLPRQRAWAAEMQAEVDARLGRTRVEIDWEAIPGLGSARTRVVVGVIVVLAWLAWLIWRR